MTAVVSDTSPVRAFAHLGRMDAVQSLFDKVLIPPVVAAELQSPPSSFRPVDVADYSFIEIANPGDDMRVDSLLTRLDRGEAEAIVLADEVHADAILVDELAARRIAGKMGLNVIGTLGVLLAAKQVGCIREIRPLIDRLRTELRFFVSTELINDILQRAGESADTGKS